MTEKSEDNYTKSTMDDQERNNHTNLRLEYEQLNLWNRHGETSSWTVGSVLGSASFYAFSQIDTICDQKTIIFISISFILAFLAFIFYYVPKITIDSLRLTKRTKKIDSILY